MAAKEIRFDQEARSKLLAGVDALERIVPTCHEDIDRVQERIVEAEKQADARLYRDLRLKVGIQATLEQKVADFREKD